MPEITRFYGIIIRMYAIDIKEHKLPHIHASYNEYRSVFDLEGNEIEGSMPSKQRKIIEAWMEIHKEELIKLWGLLVEGKEGFSISPLK